MSAAVVGQPFDTLKTRLQTNTGKHTTFVRYTTNLFRTQGVAAFYRGSFSPVLTKTMSCGVCFSVVASAKKSLGEMGFDTTNPLGPPCLLAYAVSGFVESSFYTPIESLKVKLQTSQGKTSLTSIIGT